MLNESPYQEEDAGKLVGEIFSGRLGIGDALTKLRTKVLDLTLRNRLLNFKPSKARSFQFTNDPDLDLIYERLDEEKFIPLVYVPDPPPSRYEVGTKPDVRVFARECGIGTSIDLVRPKSARRHSNLQVMAYPSDLERVSRKISSEARTVVEETGTNMLYLIFGFLEYYDSEDSEQALLAPLLSMPVTLTKGNLDQETRTYRYHLAYSGDDIAENFTLREKLRQQFRLELPELDEEEAPEAYLQKINAAVSKRRRWTTRRQLSLAFLSFGKLAIWADLDPERSPGLLKNALLSDIFKGGTPAASGSLHAEDYPIDMHIRAELPLIYDADSSQHSALIDVLDGKNLVINGPPGTGKSQTITNIVAAAMAEGKKVLFVSEKMAALNVVKQRLEKVGLGDFCLELHSNKTQKKLLLESIDRRINSKFSSPVAYERQLGVLRERKSALNSYALLLGSKVANQLDMSVHEVFWAVERRRHDLDSGVSQFAGMVFDGAAKWTPDQLDRWRQVFSSVQSSIQDMGITPSKCAWRGFSPQLLLPGDDEPILQTIRACLKHAGDLLAYAHDFENAFELRELSTQQLLTASLEQALLASASAELDGELLEQLYLGNHSNVSPASQCVSTVVTALGLARQARLKATPALADMSRPDHLLLENLNILRSTVFSEAGRKISLKEVAAKSKALTSLLTNARAQLPAGAKFPQQSETLDSQLRQLTADQALSFAFDQSGLQLGLLARKALATVREKDQALNQLASMLSDCSLTFNGTVSELQKMLEGTSIAELQPDIDCDRALADELQLFLTQGFGDWTAERFDTEVREAQATLHDAETASQDLSDFFAKLGLPVQQSASWLQSLETLISVCEQAPLELLGLRGPGLERADFVEIARCAQERHEEVLLHEQRMIETFYVNTIPDNAKLREHIAVARRGDSIFNFLRSDWRKAKAAFRSCYRGTEKFSARTMALQFASVLSCRELTSEYENDPQIKSAIGALFEGRKTDYDRVKRLSSWIGNATRALAASDFAFTVKPISLPQEQIAAINATGGKLRREAAQIQAFGTLVSQLHGLDSAVSVSRKWDLAYGPVKAQIERLKDGGRSLRKVVRSTVNVQRAILLAELRINLQHHRPVVESLITSPLTLAHLAGSLGLPDKAFGYMHLPSGIELISKQAKLVELLAGCVEQIGGHLTPQQVTEVLGWLKLSSDEAAWLRTPKSTHSVQEYFDAVAAYHDGAISVLKYLDGRVLISESVDSGFEALLCLDECESILDQVCARDDVKSHLGSYYRRLETDEVKLRACVDWGVAVRDAANNLPAGATKLLLGKEAAHVAKMANRALSNFEAAYQDYEKQVNILVSLGTIDWVEWGGGTTPQGAVDRLSVALMGARELVPWSKYLSAKGDCTEQKLDKVLAPFESGSLPPSQLVIAFEYVFFRSLARGILSRHKELGKFTGATHDTLRDEFASLDKELIHMNGLVHAAKIDRVKKLEQGVSYGRAGDLTEMSLLAREISKQKRHIPIRQLLKRAGKTLQQLKPCFMMGPLSVAQYLEQENLQFDLVVMDEASQLRPEEALGAVARGKQLVVVGDPKQLPPTNFFDRLMDEEEDDGDAASAVVGGVESILGVCEHLYRPVRTLRWHYRSKHESLIAFSNSQFYEGRLVVFPAPVKRNEHLGVNYRFVKEGVYQDRRNIPEAERVVEAVLEHMKLRKEESLGVVTLNQTQRELIEDIFDKRSLGNQSVVNFLDFHKKAGWEFFIKNLENVQGDERDVIYISTTFGCPPGTSVVRKNFGPINRPDGWRRLNVLFTRARMRIDLFTSLRSSDVMSPDERVNLGRKALHDYLVFAKTGLLPAVAGQSTGREPDSDFEISVASALQKAGFGVEPQLGVAGYFIDIGVRHVSRPGEYLAAVECDGATYHSSLSARDRDRIRQQVLESIGWKGRIIRVWSTDWFADPQGQILRLVDFLNKRIANTKPLPYVERTVLNDDHPIALSHTQFPQSGTLASVTPLLVQRPEKGFTELLVEVGDHVTYSVQAPQGEQRLTIQIVDSASNLRLNLVNEASPLAQALIGLCEGDESQLFVKGHDPRNLRVVSIKRPS